MPNECPYKRECATVIYWSKEKANFIREVCNTEKHMQCLHFSASLQPQHEERQRLYGNPHHGEPHWDEVAKQPKRSN